MSGLICLHRHLQGEIRKYFRQQPIHIDKNRAIYSTLGATDLVSVVLEFLEV